MYRVPDGQTGGRTDKDRTDKQSDRHTYRHTYRQTDRKSILPASKAQRHMYANHIMLAIFKGSGTGA